MAEAQSDDPRIEAYASEEFCRYAEKYPGASQEQVRRYLAEALANAKKRVRHEDLLAQNLNTGDRIRSGELSPEQFAEQATEETLEWQRRIAELEEENASLLEQSDRDPYNPEIYSANGWYRAMADKLRELRRNNQPAVILAFDLDGFKSYNDAQSSHIEGDNALGLAGHLAKSVLRPGDLIARLHGDEFVVVLSGAELENGVMVAERIRQAISEMPDLLKTTIPLTASIGVAMLDPAVIEKKYSSDEELVAALKKSYALADWAQYEGAKKVGKNRIGVMLADGTIRTAVITAGSESQPPVITYQTPPTPT